MYADGYGVVTNDAEAARWYRLAAEQGNAKAQYNLGIMYVNGEGVPQDRPKPCVGFGWLPNRATP